VKVRFTIDRVVAYGVDLTPIERGRFDDALRRALETHLRDRRSHPSARRSCHERVDMRFSPNGSGASLGGALGTTLAGHLWSKAFATGNRP